MPKPLDCERIAITKGNHSKDRMTLFYGAETPAYMCGYHATTMTKTDYIKLNQTKDN